jgi:mannose-6-phosphate isomerase-like protein (cupin superfamily)
LNKQICSHSFKVNDPKYKNMEAEIIPYNPDTEFYTDEHCHITELSNSHSDPDASIARARVNTGVATRWHRLHNITERYIIIEGHGLVEVGKLAPQEANVGDVVLIPPGCRQRITNIGSTDLVFLAICTPRFRQEAYEDIEDANQT